MPTRRNVRWSALALALVVVASGCGVRWDDEQRAAVTGRARTGAGVAVGAATAPGEETTSAVDGGAVVPGSETATTGDAAAPTGAAGQPAAPGAAGAVKKPCAAPATAPGVTDQQITIGSISTLSGAVPGLGASALAAVRAYVAYRNSTGGVCGRKLALKTADDGMDNGRYRAALDGMSGQVLGLAGGVGGGDAGGADVAEGKKIPVVNTPISTVFQDVSTVFDLNPPFANVNAPIAKYKYLLSQGVKKAALVYIAADQTRDEVKNKQKPQMVASGIEVVLDKEVPLSTLSFDSAAREVANSGADYLLFVSDAGQSASMAKSMRGTGHELKFEEYLTAYGTNFVELAGSAADGTSAWIRSLPNEEPNSNPEQTQFQRWMRQIAPESKPDSFAADSWASAKAFVDALDALPGPISRETLINQLRSVAVYDAGGFTAPIELGAKRNKGCFIGMRVVGGKWQRFAPAKGFLC